MLKLAMARSVPVVRHFDAHISLQVHDELCGWVPIDKAEDFKYAMSAVMESITIPHTKLLVSGGYGSSWETAK